MIDLSTEYRDLVAEQERAYRAERATRERLEELDERRYCGDKSVPAAAVLAARNEWLVTRARLANIRGRMRDNRRLLARQIGRGGEGMKRGQHKRQRRTGPRKAPTGPAACYRVARPRGLLCLRSVGQPDAARPRSTGPASIVRRAARRAASIRPSPPAPRAGTRRSRRVFGARKSSHPEWW